MQFAFAAPTMADYSGRFVDIFVFREAKKKRGKKFDHARAWWVPRVFWVGGVLSLLISIYKQFSKLS